MNDLELIKELEKILKKAIPKVDESLHFQEGFKMKDEMIVTELSLMNYSISDLQVVVPLIRKFKHLVLLNLSLNDIADISSLADFDNLSTLILWRNEIKDISPLKHLVNLVFLDLNDNTIKDISPLATLTNLKALMLERNRIMNISSLKKLERLEVLLLLDNRISNFTSLKNFEKLRRISLGGTNLKDLQFTLHIDNLEDFHLWGSFVQYFPSFNQMAKLKTLKIDSSGLRSIPEINGLKNLEELSFRDNLIENISMLGELKQLITLDLSYNGILDLSPLASLTNLQYLKLNGNKINDIKPLKDLKNLRSLMLQDNPIEDLPEWITDFNMDITWANILWEARQSISLDNNPLKNPPPEIVQRGKEAIKAWFEGTKKYIDEVKVLLVGHGEVGKTTLVKCIKGEAPDPNEPATHYIRISPHTINHKNKDVKLKFWDFGGQDVMHSTHQFFLSKRSIYILVLDGRKDEDAEYWLKHIESFGGNSPTLVVLNKVDTNPGYDVDRRFLKHKYPFIIDFYKTICSGPLRGINELREGLRLALDEVELLSVPWPTQWLPVKEGLEKMPDDFISQHAYDRLCETHGVTDPIAKDTLAGYLNDLGVIVHFKDMRLSDLHILQPRWASRAAYKIINAKVIAHNQGLLKSTWLPDIMKKEDENDFTYQPNNFPFILDLMQKFELCYSIRENNEYLIPELLGVQQPELPEHDGPVLRFYFNYEGFIPRSVISRFMVRMHEDIKENLRWRTGVVLSDETFNSMAIVIADIKEQKIKIEVSGMHRREYFAIIRKIFLSLHKTFEKLEVSEWIPAPDSDVLAIEYEELRAREEAGETQYKNFKLKKTYNVKDLLNGIESEKVRKEQYSWDAFLCYSSRDKDLVLAVAADFRKIGISYWLDDEQIQPGDNFSDKIVEGLTNSRNIIPCISANQLKSGWAKKEYQSILNRIINGSSKQKITPLVLDNTSDNDLPLFLNDIRVERYLLKEQYERLLIYLAPIKKRR